MSVRHNIRYNLAFFAFIAVLLGCSAFFTWQVEAFRSRTSKARLDRPIPSGTRVSIAHIIDGDEAVVSLADSGQRFVVRLLGIKAFDPVVNDTDLGVYGRAAVDYLRDRLGQSQSQEASVVTLEFPRFTTDTKGRVLAFARLDEQDLGLSLVREGLALAYLVYPFDREDEYRRTMEQAQRERRGLWSTEKSAQRARALLASWRASREP